MTHIDAHKVLADNDVQLENKRKYYAITISNLTLYCMQMFVIIVTQLTDEGQGTSIFIFTKIKLP